MEKFASALLPKTKAMLRNVGISLLLIIISAFFTFSGYYYKNLVIFFGLNLAWAVLFFTMAIYFLLPRSYKKERPLFFFLPGSLIVLAIAFIPCVLLSMLLIHDLETSITYAVLISILQITVTLPLSWFWYKKVVYGDRLVSSLQKELGHSVARLDFLRSQINPHFLFNALNTIYGTALQEGAERTSQGIERLADMMRFMLSENTQSKIALSKELDYLRHYIELQKLRTAPHTSILIDISIPDVDGPYEIAPMLLIPFVENAFKHGISFREPSYIKLSIEINSKTVYLRITNSRHEQNHDKPEKDHTGIGLQNVTQRLDLLYPGKHQIRMDQTDSAFGVYLEINLT